MFEYFLIFIGLWVITTIVLQIARLLAGIGDRGLGVDFMCGFVLTFSGCIESIAVAMVLGVIEKRAFIPLILVIISFIFSLFFIKTIYRPSWGSAVFMSLIMLIFYALAGWAVLNFWMS